MGDGAVVALEVVLDADLPVRVVLPLRPLMEGERVDVEPAFRHAPREVAEVLLERSRALVGIDEDERPPGVDEDGDEAEAFPVEAGLAVRPRRTPQRSVELVRPGVVRALQRLAPARAVAEQVAAMSADVDERAQLAVTAADEDDGHVPRSARRRTSPARSGSPVWPAYCQVRRKIRSCSRRATAGSEYQSQGIVSLPAIVATAPMLAIGRDSYRRQACRLRKRRPRRWYPRPHAGRRIDGSLLGARAENAHGVDECVNMASMISAAQTSAVLIRDLRGGRVRVRPVALVAVSAAVAGGVVARLRRRKGRSSPRFPRSRARRRGDARRARCPTHHPGVSTGPGRTPWPSGPRIPLR